MMILRRSLMILILMCLMVPGILPAQAEQSSRVDAAQRQGLKLGITLGTSAVSAGLFNLFWLLGDYSYNQYLATENPEDALQYRRSAGLYDTLSILSLATSALTFSFSIPMLLNYPASPALLKPPPDKDDEEYLENYAVKMTEKRDKLDMKLQRSGNRTYAQLPRIFLAVSIFTGLGNTLLFSVGSPLYHDSFSWDYDSRGIDPITIAGITLGSLANASLLLALVTSFTSPAPVKLESRRTGVQLKLRTLESGYGVDTDWFASSLEHGAFLEDRKAALKQQLDSAVAKKTRYSLSAAICYGVGLLSLGAVALEMEWYRNARDDEDSDSGRFVPGPGLIIGTASAGLLGVSLGAVISLLRPRPGRIEREIEYIDNRIEILKTTTSTSEFPDRSSQPEGDSSDNADTVR